MFIQTHTGRRVCPLEIRAGDVCLDDVAHALAYSSRYNGHGREFYSIAQHSVLVSQLLEKQGQSRRTQAWGLMHDAAEAYLGDVVTPLKGSLAVAYAGEFHTFAELEAKALETIGHAFGLVWPVPAVVKAADREVLACEAPVLLGDTTGWSLDFEPGAVHVTPWTASYSEERFKARWFELNPAREGT